MDSPKTTGPSAEPKELVGYVQNIQDMRNDSFSFDLQGQNAGTRFICFSPQKRSTVESKLKSPVKVKKFRPSKGTDFFWNDDSEMADTILDFQPIDYDNMTLANVKLCPANSLVNVVVVAKALQNKSTTSTGKSIETYVVCDATASMKLTLWEDATGKIDIGTTYEITNARVKVDQYGTVSLSNSKEGFSMKNSTAKFKAVAAAVEIEEYTGEIMSIEGFALYKLCLTCKRKLPPTNDLSIKCPQEGCGADNKIKFCSTGMYVEFKFFVEATKEIFKLTMFQEHVASLIENSQKMGESDLRKKLIEFDALKITKDKGNVVQSISLVEC